MRLHQRKNDLAGSLLVALPTLLDPNFRRTILFLSHHDPDAGSVGFILNRPREIDLGDLAPVAGSGEHIPVYEGGPVESKSLVVAQLDWHTEGEQARFRTIGEEDLPPAAGEARCDQDAENAGKGDDIRAFTGYAGWSAGQLERELVEKSWIVIPPTPDLLLPVANPEEGTSRWRALMKKLGPWYYLTAQAPDDPSLN